MKGFHSCAWFSGVFFLLAIFGCTGNKWQNEKTLHQLKQLDAKTYKNLANPPGRLNFKTILDPMLIVRVPGTPNHNVVKKFIKNLMVSLGWGLETDVFIDDTPAGRKPFENIITTLNPTVSRRLVLACHYDSKYTTNFKFIGAIDSAVPCAMLLYLAQIMQHELKAHKNSAQDVTLQFIFFDGEEPFKSWSANDSLYGARHLAKKWEQTPFPPNNKDNTNMLHRMDVMVLLDLIGASNVTFSSCFVETDRWHDALAETELQLKTSNFWSGSTKSPKIFQSPMRKHCGIEDDHLPFLERNVNIVHLIATPFPSVWHKASDVKGALDFPTIENLNRILRIFVAKYLHLPVD